MTEIEQDRDQVVRRILVIEAQLLTSKRNHYTSGPVLSLPERLTLEAERAHLEVEKHDLQVELREEMARVKEERRRDFTQQLVAKVTSAGMGHLVLESQRAAAAGEAV